MTQKWKHAQVTCWWEAGVGENCEGEACWAKACRREGCPDDLWIIAPATGRKQSLTGYRNSGHGTEGEHLPSVSINFLSIYSRFLPMGMEGAERMGMMFSLGWDIVPVKFKKCSSLASFWVEPFVLEFSLLWVLSSQATPAPRLPSAPHFAESPSTLRKEQPRGSRAETMGHRVTSLPQYLPSIGRPDFQGRQKAGRKRQTQRGKKRDGGRESLSVSNTFCAPSYNALEFSLAKI